MKELPPQEQPQIPNVFHDAFGRRWEVDDLRMPARHDPRKVYRFITNRNARGEVNFRYATTEKFIINAIEAVKARSQHGKKTA